MLMDAFKPAYNGTVNVSVGNTNSTLAVPGNGEYLLVTNPSATVIIFVETGPATVTASATLSMPILPGQARIIRRKQGDDPAAAAPGAIDTHIALIGSAAGPTTVYITPGAGGV